MGQPPRPGHGSAAEFPDLERGPDRSTGLSGRPSERSDLQDADVLERRQEAEFAAEGDVGPPPRGKHRPQYVTIATMVKVLEVGITNKVVRYRVY